MCRLILAKQYTCLQLVPGSRLSISQLIKPRRQSLHSENRVLVVLFPTLHKILGTNALELCPICNSFFVANVTTVNNYVDSICCKYHVTMATSPPTVNMEHTWDVLNNIK